MAKKDTKKKGKINSIYIRGASNGIIVEVEREAEKYDCTTIICVSTEAACTLMEDLITELRNQ